MREARKKRKLFTWWQLCRFCIRRCRRDCFRLTHVREHLHMLHHRLFLKTLTLYYMIGGICSVVQNYSLLRSSSIYCLFANQGYHSYPTISLQILLSCRRLLDRYCQEMALVKSCSLPSNEGLRFGYVKFSRSFGRKRIVISNDMEVDSSFMTPTKKHCNQDSVFSSERSVIEALPLDILIRILCGVEHDDLKRLFHVSKSIREATVIAKQWHFAYSTPTKKLAFRDSMGNENWGKLDEVEAPNAPVQSRVPQSRLIEKKQEGWPKRALFMEMETEM